MAHFVELTSSDSDSKTPVVINAAYVIKVHPESIDPEKVTVIYFAEQDDPLKVQGHYRDIVKKLSARSS